MHFKKIKFISLSSIHTISIGFFLSKFIEPGSCVMLDGEVSTGKTTFVKGVAHGLMIKKAEYVNSPTYSLVNKYCGKYSLCHIDLYRLNKHYRLVDLELNDILNSGNICIIEWAKKANKNELPNKTIQIYFSKISDNVRNINIKLCLIR